MRKESLSIQVPVWVGELLDVLAFDQGVKKADMVTKILENWCLTSQTSRGKAARALYERGKPYVR